MEHISVLLNESIEMLNIKEDGIYVDCTLGRGGHSSEILKRLKSGHLYAFDCDQNAIDESMPRLKSIGDNFTVIHSPFENLKRELAQRGVDKVDGIFMDLGVSSPQFDDGQRGFSYRMNARLDMRMDQSQDLDAYKVVNTYDKEDLIRILKRYGEEPFAVIKSALPQAVLRKKGHPAKQTFQAIRIEVNHELEQLDTVLQDGLTMLKPHGRMAVITFHSLEDRIVKEIFKEVAVAKKVNKRLPQVGTENLEYQLVNRKPVLASSEELENNNRAHSAKLRGIEKKG